MKNIRCADLKNIRCVDLVFVICCSTFVEIWKKNAPFLYPGKHTRAWYTKHSHTLCSTLTRLRVAFFDRPMATRYRSVIEQPWTLLFRHVYNYTFSTNWPSESRFERNTTNVLGITKIKLQHGTTANTGYTHFGWGTELLTHLESFNLPAQW